MITKVFEIVDHTNDEVYFTQGLWPTLEEAIEAIEDLEPNDLDSFDSAEDYCRVQIHERKFGYHDLGHCLYTVEFTGRYDAERDDYVWDRRDFF